LFVIRSEAEESAGAFAFAVAFSGSTQSRHPERSSLRTLQAAQSKSLP
jgi:hypothetical protein